MCLQQIYIQKYGVLVPCGKCPSCKLKRVNAWVMRLENEARIHNTSLFITLTYEQPPMSTNNFMTLHKPDFQNFIKRLRKNIHGNKKSTIKYYACGEYGGKTWRPHYHAIIYDVFQDQVEKAWPLGHIHVGDVNANTIAYCCKYICKDKRVGMFAKDDRIREFSLMSKNLGKNYITPETIRYHTADLNSFVLKNGGHKMCLPRYYRDKIFTEDQRLIMNYNTQQTQILKERAIIASLNGGRDEWDEKKRVAYRHEIKNAQWLEKSRNKI